MIFSYHLSLQRCVVMQVMFEPVIYDIRYIMVRRLVGYRFLFVLVPCHLF